MWHKNILRKARDKLDIPDADREKENYPLSCSLLIDKGYEGVQSKVRAFYSTEKPPGKGLRTIKGYLTLTRHQTGLLLKCYFAREVC